MIEKYQGFIYSCDNCKSTHRHEGSGAHYPNSTPPMWAAVKVILGHRRAPIRLFDSCGGDGLLCEECATKATEAMRDALAIARASK